MAKTKKVDHRYVNLQPTSTMVPGPDGQRVTISAWEKRHNNVAIGAVFVVEGEHYAKFVSPKGPLYPFPAGADDPRTSATKASTPKSPPASSTEGDKAGAGDAGDADSKSGDSAGEAADESGAGDAPAGDDASAGDGQEGAAEATTEGKGLKDRAKKKAAKKPAKPKKKKS